MHKILRDYRRLCRAEGAELRSIERRGRHYALHFDGGFVIAPGTPSDHRSHRNLRATIRRLGF